METRGSVSDCETASHAQSNGSSNHSTPLKHRSRFSRWLRRKTKAQRKQYEEGVGHPFPWARHIVKKRAFENIVFATILTNCVFIGMQANDFSEDSAVMSLAEHFFTCAFLVDLVLRILGNGWTWMLARENWFDIVLVLSSVMTMWVLVPMGAGVGMVRKLTVFRTLRVVRIARAVRMRPEMKEMWKLLKGLVDSSETLFWTSVMICIFLYCFGIWCTTWIARQDQFSTNALVQEQFGDVPKSMLTLLQMLTLDSWGSVARDLMQTNNRGAGLLFVLFVTMGEFVVMNLITAVIVEHAFADAQSEEEYHAKRRAAKAQKELDKLTEVFHDLDEDGSGKLGWEEIMAAARNRNIRMRLKALDFSQKDMTDLWDILDYGGGDLSVEEFTGGMKKLRGDANAKDILKLYRELRVMESSISTMTDDMDGAQKKMATAKVQLQRTKMDIVALQRTLQRVKETLQAAASSQAIH